MRYREVFSRNTGSPREIRSLASGSRATGSQNCASFAVRDIDWTVSDLYQHCKFEERLSEKVCRDYRNVARRFLLTRNGEISRQSNGRFLEGWSEILDC
jgi:hypothetical protein